MVRTDPGKVESPLMIMRVYIMNAVQFDSILLVASRANFQFVVCTILQYTRVHHDLPTVYTPPVRSLLNIAVSYSGADHGVMLYKLQYEICVWDSKRDVRTDPLGSYYAAHKSNSLAGGGGGVPLRMQLYIITACCIQPVVNIYIYCAQWIEIEFIKLRTFAEQIKSDIVPGRLGVQY